MIQLGKVQYKELIGLDTKYFNVLIQGVYGDYTRVEKVGLLINTEKVGFYFKMRVTEYCNGDTVDTNITYDGIVKYHSDGCYMIVLSNDGISQDYYVHECTVLSSMPVAKEKEKERLDVIENTLDLVFKLAHKTKDERYNFDICICKKLIQVWEDVFYRSMYQDYSKYTLYFKNKDEIVEKFKVVEFKKEIIKPENLNETSNILVGKSKYGFYSKLFVVFNN